MSSLSEFYVAHFSALINNVNVRPHGYIFEIFHHDKFYVLLSFVSSHFQSYIDELIEWCSVNEYIKKCTGILLKSSFPYMLVQAFLKLKVRRTCLEQVSTSDVLDAHLHQGAQTQKNYIRDP